MKTDDLSRSDLDGWGTPRVLVHDWHDGVVDALVRLETGRWLYCNTIANRRGPEVSLRRLYWVHVLDEATSATFESLFAGDATGELEHIEETADEAAFARSMEASRRRPRSRWLLESEDLMLLTGYWELAPTPPSDA